MRLHRYGRGAGPSGSTDIATGGVHGHGPGGPVEPAPKHRHADAQGAIERHLAEIGRDALGNMSVECWCRRKVVWVRPEVIAACRTVSCGFETCKEPA